MTLALLIGFLRKASQTWLLGVQHVSLSSVTGEEAESNRVLLPFPYWTLRLGVTALDAMLCPMERGPGVPERTRRVCLTMCLVLLGVCGVWKSSRTAHCYSGDFRQASQHPPFPTGFQFPPILQTAFCRSGLRTGTWLQEPHCVKGHTHCQGQDFIATIIPKSWIGDILIKGSDSLSRFYWDEGLCTTHLPQLITNLNIPPRSEKPSFHETMSQNRRKKRV